MWVYWYVYCSYGGSAPSGDVQVGTFRSLRVFGGKYNGFDVCVQSKRSIQLKYIQNINNITLIFFYFVGDIFKSDVSIITKMRAMSLRKVLET